MSGIAGLWNLDGAPVDQALVTAMADMIGHRGTDSAGSAVRGAVGLACRQRWITPEDVGERQPVQGPSGSLLIMDGRLDNRDELLPKLDVPAHASDARVALAAWEKWGEGFAEHLNGDFAIAVFDPRPRALVLTRDAIGVRPLYWFRGDGFFAFGSEVKALLAHPAIPARPDDDGLADYLLMGSRPMLEPWRTCFAGISTLVPGHQVRVSESGVQVRRYWDFDGTRQLRLGSFAEYAEAFRHHFSTAVKRRARSAHPVAVSVSGGLDSSSIFCQAESLRRAGSVTARVLPWSYVGPFGTTSDEREYLAAMERDYGIPIPRIPIAPLLGVVDGAERQLWHIESPFLDYMWGLTRQLHGAVHDAGARVLLSGHWGDQVLFSSAYLVDLVRRMAWGEARRHLREYGNWFGPGEATVLRRRFLRDVVRHHTPDCAIPALKWFRRNIVRAERARSWFTEDFRRKASRHANEPARVDGRFHSAQARSLYVEFRSKYHVHCMEWNNKVGAMHGLETAFPFLDRDLLGFLMAIPGEVQNRGGVPRALLRESMAGVLPAEIRGRTWKADFTDLVNEGVDTDFPVITHALNHESLGVRLGYFDAAVLDEAVATLRASLKGTTSVASWDLTDLYGLEVWLRLFLGGERPAALSAHYREAE